MCGTVPGFFASDLRAPVSDLCSPVERLSDSDPRAATRRRRLSDTDPPARPAAATRRRRSGYDPYSDVKRVL